ncbi:GNAT family N-acetyltransferase [candidate division WOR-3 bacterium]|nr:GNAT family N-acetyltransferase [candidate division WOR-3 bacterium]
MEIKHLNKDTIIAEACCVGDDRGLEKRTELTEQGRTALSAARIKADWLKKMIPEGLSAKIAYSGDKAVGFIEYMPIELSNFHKGKDLYIINCMTAPHTPPWGGPHRERIPGCGSALLTAMIEDVKNKCKGIITPFGFAYTDDMRGFFSKFGFEEFENEGLKMLIKRFEPVEPPSPIRYEQRYQFRQIPGKAVVDIFWSSMCPAAPYTLLNLRDVCKEFEEEVVFNEFCVDDREALNKYGIEAGAYVNGKYPWSTYGPLSKEEIREVLKKFSKKYV